MSRCISKCRDPLHSMLMKLHTWITTTWTDTVVHEPDSFDREGWIDFALVHGAGREVVFAGVRFRRDKPVGMTVVFPVSPEHDPEGWIHPDAGTNRPLGYALGVPRPFQKALSDREWEYLFALITQVRRNSGGS